MDLLEKKRHIRRVVICLVASANYSCMRNIGIGSAARGRTLEVRTWKAGTRLHEQVDLFDVDASCFGGSIRFEVYQVYILIGSLRRIWWLA